MIPPSVIEDIKFRNDIEDVISEYVQLKRAGSNIKGLCPFHSEKTPSFTVFGNTKSFYCFGCGAAGDVISFVMRAENLDYVGALEFLAKRSGIEIPPTAYAGQDTDSNIRRSRIYEMNRDAARFFHDQLKQSTAALSYIKTRQLSSAAVKHFGLGYAPDSFNATHDHMKKLGYTDEELVAGFICGRSKKTDRLFDMYRNRLMFPVIDVSGNIIAFGGRRLNENDPQKYINSSDTPAFKKSRNLFALNFAKSHCKDELILCEGYMDVVSLHAAGVENAVASLGTALTSEQARLMKKYTSRVIISYDSDAAGQKAADRAFGLLKEAGLDVKLLSLGDVKDPDDYIKKYGVESFRQKLGGSKSEFEFRYEGIVSRYDMDTLDGRVKAASELVKVISAVPSAVERDMYILRVSQSLGTDKNGIKSDVEKLRRSSQNKAKKESSRKMMLSTEGYGDKVNPDYIKNVRAAASEELILGLLLRHSEYMDLIKQKKIQLSSEDFESDFNKRVFETVMSGADDGGDFDIGMLNGIFTPEEVSRVTKMMISREGLSNTEDVLKEAVSSLRAAKEKSGLSIEEILSKKRKEIGV